MRVKCPVCGEQVTARKAATRWHPEYEHRMLTRHLDGSRLCWASGMRVELRMVSEYREILDDGRVHHITARPPVIEIANMGDFAEEHRGLES